MKSKAPRLTEVFSIPALKEATPFANTAAQTTGAPGVQGQVFIYSQDLRQIQDSGVPFRGKIYYFAFKNKSDKEASQDLWQFQTKGATNKAIQFPSLKIEGALDSNAIASARYQSPNDKSDMEEFMAKPPGQASTGLPHGKGWMVVGESMFAAFKPSLKKV